LVHRIEIGNITLVGLFGIRCCCWSHLTAGLGILYGLWAYFESELLWRASRSPQPHTSGEWGASLWAEVRRREFSERYQTITVVSVFRNFQSTWVHSYMLSVYWNDTAVSEEGPVPDIRIKESASALGAPSDKDSPYDRWSTPPFCMKTVTKYYIIICPEHSLRIMWCGLNRQVIFSHARNGCSITIQLHWIFTETGPCAGYVSGIIDFIRFVLWVISSSE
jgi:hypothetical protein